MLGTGDCDIEKTKLIAFGFDCVASLTFGLVKIVVYPSDAGCGIDVTNAFVFIDRY